jgi:hypothetical protein
VRSVRPYASAIQKPVEGAPRRFFGFGFPGGFAQARYALLRRFAAGGHGRLRKCVRAGGREARCIGDGARHGGD